MNHVASDRMFLLASLVAVACAAFYEPVIYGNDMGSIERYLRQEMGSRLKNGIELLTVADDGADRFAVFRGAEKRPDERWIVRFRQNENGDYEAYLNSRRMYGPHPVQCVYTQPLGGYSGDREVCYAVWNESEHLAEIRFRLDGGPAETVSISTPPSLTIWRFRGGESGWHLESTYYNDAGDEL